MIGQEVLCVCAGELRNAAIAIQVRVAAVGQHLHQTCICIVAIFKLKL
jgi:hypothetical protein